MIAAMSFNGGTMKLNGVAEGTTPSAGVGALSLSSSSSIDLTSTSLLHFGASNLQTWAGTLNILNWNGTLVTGGGAEELLFDNNVTSLTAAQLMEIQFTNPAGLPAGSYLATFGTVADGEIVPGVPIPEPATWISGALVALVISWSQRQRLRSVLRSRTAVG